MTCPIPAFAQEAYAVLRTRFGDEPFASDYLSWFISPQMVKKTLHTLGRSGWIGRVSKGSYVCKAPEEIVQAMVRFRVPELLERAARPYAYVEASAAEIWTDHIYIQRSWEHSPYFVAVLREDVDFWVAYFRARKVRVFVDGPQPALGEFVVLKPQTRLRAETHENVPVQPLAAVAKYCERHLEAFEFPLAYLKAKYGVATRARLDPRVVAEARRSL